MKTSRKARVSVAILLGVLAGALSWWLIQGDEARKVEVLKARALCMVDLPEGTPAASVAFTNSRTVELFQVAMQVKPGGEALSVSISGDQGLVGNASGVIARSFGLGRDVPPGTYTVTLRQEAGGRGGTAWIADEMPSYVTGWQLLSRTYVGLLMVAALGLALSRKAKHSRAYALSLSAFHSLLLCLVLLFVYLMFHEGGHALAQIAFGTFDLARSDFWGLRGHPHSGGAMGRSLDPWQQTTISCAGPLLPTLAGLGLFGLWNLPSGRKFRGRRPMVNLYGSAIVGMLVLPELICEPAYLLGLIDAEGDLIGSVTRAGGPVWLVRGLLLSSVVVSGFIVSRVVPEVVKEWKARFLVPH